MFWSSITGGQAAEAMSSVRMKRAAAQWPGSWHAALGLWFEGNVVGTCGLPKGGHPLARCLAQVKSSGPSVRWHYTPNGLIPSPLVAQSGWSVQPPGSGSFIPMTYSDFGWKYNDTCPSCIGKRVWGGGRTLAWLGGHYLAADGPCAALRSAVAV